MPDSGQARRVRRPLTETRARLLEAGCELARRDGVTPVAGVRLSEAAELVGLTTGSAYKIWSSQEEYRRDLALHLARSFDWSRISAVLPDLESQPGDWSAWSVAEAYFERFRDNGDFFVALQLWGVIEPDVELADAIRSGYAGVTKDTETVVQLYLDLNERRVRDPYSIREVSVALTAVTEGASLRARFDPAALVSSDRRVSTSYTDLVRAVLAFYTEPVDTT